MGIKVKTAAFTIGGLAALWMVNKVLNITVRTVDTMAETSKWKAYYKYGEHKHAVPPGYARYGDWRSPEQQAEDEKEKAAEERQAGREKVDMKPIGESLERIAKAYLKTKGVDLDKDLPRVSYKDYYHSRAEQNDISEEIQDAFETKDRETVKEEMADLLDLPKEVVDKALDDLPEEEERQAVKYSEEHPDGKIIDIPVRSDENEETNE